MENIVNTNNPSLKLCALKVGVFSTLRISLPLVPSTATGVKVIVSTDTAHYEYSASYDSTSKSWLCDIAAGQFSSVGKLKYEVSYTYNNKPFWDGQGWIEVVQATVTGITPTPMPNPPRYAVTSVNGVGTTDANGAITIPSVHTGSVDPTSTTGYLANDIYVNLTTGYMFVLASVSGALSWVSCGGGGGGGGGECAIVILTIEDDVAKKDGETITGGEIYTLTQNGKVPFIVNGNIILPCVLANSSRAFFSCTIDVLGTSSVVTIYVNESGYCTSTENEIASKTDVAKASGFKTSISGATTNLAISLRGVGQQYFNVAGNTTFTLPAIASVGVGGIRWLFHIADGIDASNVKFRDNAGHTIVTNASSLAYNGAITGAAMGLNHAWKMVTMRVFKNPQGDDFIYLEV